MRLFDFERKWLVQIFSIILPRSNSFPIGAQDAPMNLFLDDLISRAPKSFGLGLRFALFAAVFYPLWASLRPRTLFALSGEEQVQALEQMARSRFYIVRELPMLLKMTACLGFFGLPEIQRSMGIEPTDLLPAPQLRKDRRS